jgi:hypothetical protein
LLLCSQFGKNRFIESNRVFLGVTLFYVEKEKDIHCAICKCKNYIHHQYIAGVGLIGPDYPHSVYGQRVVEIREREHELQRDA